jgi:hypothetical protein
MARTYSHICATFPLANALPKLNAIARWNADDIRRDDQKHF